LSAPPSSSAAPIDAGAPFGATAEGAPSGAASVGQGGELAAGAEPAPSVFAADLVALGLDPQNLPPLDKLDPRVLRGVMRLFARSLGVKCADCHERADDDVARAGGAASLGFALPTRRKKIATRMWNEFLVKLSAQDGKPLFCDSCHAGRVHYLDRRDKKALAAWMDAHFVAKLARKDGKDHGCETCHVDMDMTFLTAWGR
jgi:formate-dependent nitrite reductase cytochrome c552 subunit